MADLSGVCDAHGIVIFCTDDAAAAGTSVETSPSRDGVPTSWPPVWYWASCQHNVLTGKPNGPHPSRTAALADATMLMAAHDHHTVLVGSDLG